MWNNFDAFYQNYMSDPFSQYIFNSPFLVLVILMLGLALKETFACWDQADDKECKLNHGQRICLTIAGWAFCLLNFAILLALAGYLFQGTTIRHATLMWKVGMIGIVVCVAVASICCMFGDAD